MEVMAMSKTGMSFEEALDMGRSGEGRVVDYLERNGWWTFPSYKYTNDGDEAPKITREEEGLNTVDIEAFLGGTHRWVEVKTKSEPREVPPYAPEPHDYEQGMDIPCWEGYKRFQEVTGINVWIFFCEDNNGTFAISTLERLKGSHTSKIDKDHERYNPAKQPDEMIYWDREDLRIVKQNATPSSGAFGDEELKGWL